MTRSIACLVLAAGLWCGCDKDAGTSGDANETDGAECAPPVVVEPPEPDPELRMCKEMALIRTCCFGADPNDGIPTYGPCWNAFHWIGPPSEDIPAPEVCAELMPVALECAMALPEVSCDELQAFYDGIYSRDPPNRPGPPTVDTMPCHAEVMALWDAGCQPEF